MDNLIFKAASMTNIHSDSDKPDFYTVLCKVKGTRKGWSYCGDGKDQIIKVNSLKEARGLSQIFKANHEALKAEVPHGQ